MGWRKKMEKARKLHRPSLKNWEQDGLSEVFPTFVKDLSRRPNYERFILGNGGSSTSHQIRQDGHNQLHQIPAVLDGLSVRPEDFYQYELNSIPCVIQNVPSGWDGGERRDRWKAQKEWTLDALPGNDTLMKYTFKCGEDDDGKNIRVKLKHFIEYTHNNKDDSPLYVFDSTFDEDEHSKQLLDHYRVPSYFGDDLFGLVSESRRPPYRWWLLGPERSGTCVHIDPLATSAWNTLIQGEKRWVVFPPHLSKDIVKGKGLVESHEDDEAIHYFMYILPRIKRKAEKMRSDPKYRDFRCYEFTQKAGETVFVPNGWWHAVLNLNHSVAVTQNFCSPRNFDAVWMKTRTGRKRMAWKWLCQLETKYPDLAERAKAMNKRDDFVMKYDPVEIERRERMERLRKKERKRRKMLRQDKVPVWKAATFEATGEATKSPGVSTALDNSCSSDRTMQDRATVSP